MHHAPPHRTIELLDRPGRSSCIAFISTGQGSGYQMGNIHLRQDRQCTCSRIMYSGVEILGAFRSVHGHRYGRICRDGCRGGLLVTQLACINHEFG